MSDESETILTHVTAGRWYHAPDGQLAFANSEVRALVEKHVAAGWYPAPYQIGHEFVVHLQIAALAPPDGVPVPSHLPEYVVAFDTGVDCRVVLLRSFGEYVTVYAKLVKIVESVMVSHVQEGLFTAELEVPEGHA